MRQSELMIDLIKIYGENFAEIIIENSDGISGLHKIKKNCSYNDLVDLNDSLKSQKSFSFQEDIRNSLGEITVLKSIDQISKHSQSLIDKIKRSKIEMVEISQKLFEENEEMIIQTLLLKSKSKTELKQLKVEGNEAVFAQVKDIAKIKWGKAYTQNLNDSIATNYSVFEYNILTDPIITTLKLL